jgi:hypothetical protein
MQFIEVPKNARGLTFGEHLDGIILERHLFGQCIFILCRSAKHRCNITVGKGVVVGTRAADENKQQAAKERAQPVSFITHKTSPLPMA